MHILFLFVFFLQFSEASVIFNDADFFTAFESKFGPLKTQFQTPKGSLTFEISYDNHEEYLPCYKNARAYKSDEKFWHDVEAVFTGKLRDHSRDTGGADLLLRLSADSGSKRKREDDEGNEIGNSPKKRKLEEQSVPVTKSVGVNTEEEEKKVKEREGLEALKFYERSFSLEHKFSLDYFECLTKRVGVLTLKLTSVEGETLSPYAHKIHAYKNPLEIFDYLSLWFRSEIKYQTHVHHRLAAGKFYV